MTTISHDINEPLTYANAPSYIGDDGIEYVDEDALMTLTEREMPKWAPLFERLSGQ